MFCTWSVIKNTVVNGSETKESERGLRASDINNANSERAKLFEDSEKDGLEYPRMISEPN